MNNGPSMNQQIFNMGFSVETTSAYLLCCGISDTGEAISTKKLLEVWNSDQESLMKSLEELVQKNILCKIISSDQNGNTIYQLSDEKEWKKQCH